MSKISTRIRSLVSIILVLAIMAGNAIIPAAVSAAPVASPYAKGDINGDSKCEAVDARLALRAALGKYELDTQTQFPAADVNLDEQVTASDARMILRFALGKIIVFPTKEQLAFDALVEDIFRYDVTASTIVLHFTVVNPAAMGITAPEVSLGIEDRDPSIYSALRSRFEAVDRNDLTGTQKITYDVIAYEHMLADEWNEQYDLLEDPLECSDGWHINIISNMVEYPLRSAQDVEDYLLLCSQIPDLMEYILELQQRKIDNNLFMSAANLQQTVYEIYEFISAEENPLITSFNTRIDGVSELSSAKKNAYKETNESLINNVVEAAYEKVLDFLVENEDKAAGYVLADVSGGKDFYRYTMKKIGLDITPELLIQKMDTTIRDILGRMDQYYINNPYLDYDVLVPSLEEEDATAYINYLREKAKADFPALPASVQFQVKEVDEALQEASRPAFYFFPAIDRPGENAIYVNPLYMYDSNVMYHTMAHEGFPGHLLHLATLRSSSLPNYRKITMYTAQVEGWAIYAEQYAYQYAEAEKNTRDCFADYNLLDTVAYARMEIGVNYEGWSAEDLCDAYSEWVGVQLPLDFAEMMREDLLTHPFSMLPYIAGYYETLMLAESYGTSSIKEFHTEYLNLGSVPFAIAKAYFEEIR